MMLKTLGKWRHREKLEKKPTELNTLRMPMGPHFPWDPMETVIVFHNFLITLHPHPAPETQPMC